MTSPDLTGKTIVLTGGCGGIGRVIVRVLAEHGATVAVNDVVAEETAMALLREEGAAKPNVLYFQADVTRPDAVEDLLDAVSESAGMPDIVCCHAGVVDAFPIEQYPAEKFDALLDLNLRSAFLVAKAASRRWIQYGTAGHLLFTSSWVQDTPWPEITPYCASKAGLKALMRGFARELAPHGIRANAVAPGIVEVGMAKRQWDTDPQYQARARKAIPLGYLQPAETVADGFLFLCSDMARYMTGSVLLVDGGCSLYPMD
jgi:NAD(P)-dependent dehydrogenase (short-subunit alcohol dehydrogenase family)